MKFLFFIFFIFSNCIVAQVDTVKLKKVRFEGILEYGISYGNNTETDVLPERADIFLNNSKKYGSNTEFGLHVYFFNKIIVQAEYTHDKFNADRKNITSEIKSSKSNYFIQAEPKYDRSEGSTGDYDLNYLRVGVGGNFRLTKSKYLQPYVCYAIGKGRMPNGNFAYKDNLSNDFYINEFSFNSTMTKGYVAGIRYKYFADLIYDDGTFSPMYAHFGIKLEVAAMNITGKGNILRKEGVTNSESSTSFEFSKNYQYITLGVSCGLGWKSKKHANSLFFSSYPIKKWKTLKERIKEKKKSS